MCVCMHVCMCVYICICDHSYLPSHAVKSQKRNTVAVIKSSHQRNVIGAQHSSSYTCHNVIMDSHAALERRIMVALIECLKAGL